MKTHFIFLSLILALLALSLWTNAVVGQSVSAQQAFMPGGCNVSGSISSDTTWSPATCDPYIVTGSIIVQAGVTLTIEPGTTIKFDSLKVMIVRGKLVSIGTEANPIAFTSNAPAPAKGDWGYLFLADSSPDDPQCDGSGSILQYTIIEYGGGSTTSNNGALRIEDSSPCIDNNIIRYNKADGMHVWHNNNGNLKISNNNITDNGIAESVQVSGIRVSSSDTLTITDNTISDNTYVGIYLNNSNVLTITGNTISNNTHTGIDITGSDITISYNTVMGNGTSSDGEFGSGTGGISIYGSNNTISDNTIRGNSGTGISAPNSTISNNFITENSTSSNGGIYAYNSNINNNIIMKKSGVLVVSVLRVVPSPTIPLQKIVDYSTNSLPI